MNIYHKIANIQDEVQNISKDGKNAHFSNTYATYEQVMEVLRPVLRKNKLMICHAFELEGREGIIPVTTHLVDLEDEKTITSTLDIPILKNDPQAAGSAITYAKRYSILAMLGLGTEDDDGNVGSGRTVTQNAPSGSTPKPTSTNNTCPTHKGAPVNSYGGHKLESGAWCNDFKNPRTNVHDVEIN